uniref:Uncharacterized protein n=1 Tax=Fagus sylvatica TaxID=28930 RepID=A0A2N9GI18_FAGSY
MLFASFRSIHCYSFLFHNFTTFSLINSLFKLFSTTFIITLLAEAHFSLCFLILPETKGTQDLNQRESEQSQMVPEPQSHLGFQATKNSDSKEFGSGSEILKAKTVRHRPRAS